MMQKSSHGVRRDSSESVALKLNQREDKLLEKSLQSIIKAERQCQADFEATRRSLVRKKQKNKQGTDNKVHETNSRDINIVISDYESRDSVTLPPLSAGRTSHISPNIDQQRVIASRQLSCPNKSNNLQILDDVLQNRRGSFPEALIRRRKTSRDDMFLVVPRPPLEKRQSRSSYPPETPLIASSKSLPASPSSSSNNSPLLQRRNHHKFAFKTSWLKRARESPSLPREILVANMSQHYVRADSTSELDKVSEHNDVKINKDDLKYSSESDCDEIE